jgi:hypothetical protein
VGLALMDLVRVFPTPPFPGREKRREETPT